MSLRQRGQEVVVRIAVDGQVQPGSFFKVKSFTNTPRDELVEEDYLGEDVADLDYRHDGHDFGFELAELDDRVLRFMDTIITREATHTKHPDITVTVLNRYREAGQRAVAEVYYDVVMRVSERGFAGRKEYTAGKFEGKAKRKVLINQ